MKIFTDWRNSKSQKGFEGFIFSEKCNVVKKAVKRIKKRGLLILLMLAQIFLFNEYVFAQRMFPETNDMIFLENENIKVSLSKDRPIIHDYLYKPNNGSISGDISRSTPRIVFYKGAENVMRNFTNILYEATHTDRKVIYHVRATYEDKPAVEFDLIYYLAADDLVIEFNNVVEHDNFYLINVRLPRLVSVRGDGMTAKLAIPAEAGRLIDVASTSSKDYEYDINWLNSILAGLVYNTKVMGIVDTESLENHCIAGVFERNGIKYGSLSMNIIYRLKDYDLAEFGQIIPVTDPKYLLKVQDFCKITVSIAGDYDNDGEVSWVDGTKLLRDKIKVSSNPYYADKDISELYLDRPGAQRYIKFADVLDRIKEFANRADAPARVLYLSGWQYEGHDSGYPSVDKVNERLGGYDELVNLIKEAKKYNVTVSFHDNYDDAYKEHPGWDPDVICRDSQGNLMKGGYWDGGQSYLISSYKYALKSGLERVRDTLKRYPVADTYFIDVISGGYNNGRKYDFNPESPAAAQKNFEGKLMIIQEFNKHGVDVTTEDFSGFFVGHVGYFAKIIDNDNVYFRNEERIPLIPFIFHSKTCYGTSFRGSLKRLLYGERAGSSNAINHILDALPKQKFFGKTMKAYHQDGDIERVTYEDGSYVEINNSVMKYTVVVDDRVIAKDFTSFVPTKEDVFLACSREGGRFNYPVPKEWNNSNKIHVYKMNRDGSRDEVRFRLIDGNIEFYSEPNEGYKVIYQ